MAERTNIRCVGRCNETYNAKGRAALGASQVQYSQWKLNLYGSYHYRTQNINQPQGIVIPLLQRVRLVDEWYVPLI
jgi:hypothetical protein